MFEKGRARTAVTLAIAAGAAVAAPSAGAVLVVTRRGRPTVT